VTDRETPYRPDIDGLRAVSILLVIAYHAHPWLVPGGFVGVDVFFVISGFLITRIIISQHESGVFSILDFYARRVRRIVPALLVVLAATYLIGWAILLPDQFTLLGKNIVASVAFAANLFQLTQIGYFAPDAADNPLLHIWSLGVEEQFYIFWPPALLLISRLKNRMPWIVALAAASFCVSLSIFAGHSDWAFYSPLPRAWELLAGGLLAERARRKPMNFGLISSNLLGGLGIAAICVAAMALDRTRSFPGLYALLPVLGAMMIIASPNSLVSRFFLSSRPMVWIGLISYPLYLWHWPMLSYLAILRNGVPNFLEIWAAVILATVFSYLTYRFVELPLRRRKDAVAKLSFGLAFAGVAGVVTVAAGGFNFRFPPEVRSIAQTAPGVNGGFSDGCFLEPTGAEFTESCIEKGSKPLVFLWGDSTAAALYPGLKDAARKRQSFRLARFSAAACAPILDQGTNERCDKSNRIVLDFIESSRPDIVLLHAMWSDKNDLEKLRGTIDRLRSSKVPRIMLLGPVPVWKRTLPHTLINYYRFQHRIPDRITTGVSGPEADERMRTFSKAEGIEYVSVWRALCNSDGCLTRAGPDASQVLVTDNTHLSDTGSKFLIGELAKELALP
jgi:peptidoglycan/LPS O-acetylase OafA/YrhL